MSTAATTPPSPFSLAEPYCQLMTLTQHPTELVRNDRFPAAGHVWSDPERYAIAHAWAAQVPLLVRGEAGCGKSQLARALAKVLNVPLEMEVIHPRFEANDLKFREDPVRRLAVAQVLHALKPENLGGFRLRNWIDSELDPRKFVIKGSFWRAFEQQASNTQSWWPNAVLLIDEVSRCQLRIR
jgi:MoxR-like ATPase